MERTKLNEILANLTEAVEQSKVHADFGAFGVISRMNDNFHTLKDEFNKKRRRTANKRVVAALQSIAVDAVIAQTLL